MQGGSARRKSLLRRNEGVESEASIIESARGRERVRVAVFRAIVMREVGIALERAVGDCLWYVICTGGAVLVAEGFEGLVSEDRGWGSGTGFVA